MANPQTEDGFTPIANEIIEAFARIRISGQEWQVLWVIIRQTYGWQKKEDSISLSQIAKRTGLKIPNICRSMKQLLSKQIIATIKNDSSNITTYRFIKNYERWQPLSKQIVPRQATIVLDNSLLSKQIEDPLSKQIDTKERVKQTNTKEKNHTLMPIGKKEENKKAKVSKKSKEEKLLELKELMKNDIRFQNFFKLYPVGWTDDNSQFHPYYIKKEELYLHWQKLSKEDIDEIWEHINIYLNRCKFLVSPLKYIKEKIWILVPLASLQKLPERHKIQKEDQLNERRPQNQITASGERLQKYKEFERKSFVKQFGREPKPGELD